MTIPMRHIVLGTLLVLISPAALAGWRLEPEGSRLVFVSIKNNASAEAHRFTQISGSVADDGKGVLNVSLDGVETGIPLRNQRMREMLFETATFPQATAKVNVDLTPSQLPALGAFTVVHTEVTLIIRDMSDRIPADLRITRISARQYLVTSEQPLIVDAGRFGLINGIDALRKAAGLQAIGSSVPVSVTLLFSAD